MSKSESAPKDGLGVPSEIASDPKAQELLRAWTSRGELICSLRPEAWDDAGSWGILLADVARHVADAVHTLKGDDTRTTVARIRTLFNAELTDPTDEPHGRPEI